MQTEKKTKEQIAAEQNAFLRTPQGQEFVAHMHSLAGNPVPKAGEYPILTWRESTT